MLSVCRICVAELVDHLFDLPREANALPLAQLLQEIREESIPKAAVVNIWSKLARPRSRGNNRKVNVARAKSAASVPSISSRALEV